MDHWLPISDHKPNYDDQETSSLLSWINMKSGMEHDFCFGEMKENNNEGDHCGNLSYQQQLLRMDQANSSSEAILA